MRLLWSVEKKEMDTQNIPFQEDDKESYVRDIMHRIVAQSC
jgi:hypothetical protein